MEKVREKDIYKIPEDRGAGKRRRRPISRRRRRRRRNYTKIKKHEKTKVGYNPFLNFLRRYRKKHTEWTVIKTAIEGAQKWIKMNKEERDKYRITKGCGGCRRKRSRSGGSKKRRRSGGKGRRGSCGGKGSKKRRGGKKRKRSGGSSRGRKSRGSSGKKRRKKSPCAAASDTTNSGSSAEAELMDTANNGTAEQFFGRNMV